MTGIRSAFVLLAAFVGLTFGASQLQASPTSGGTGATSHIADKPSSQRKSDADLRRRAEDLAGAASERFSEILSGKVGDRAARGADANSKSAQHSDDILLFPLWDWLDRASRDYEAVIVSKLKSRSGEVDIVTSPSRVVAQVEVPSAPPAQGSPTPQPGWGSIIENIREWLSRANRSYRNEIVKKLAKPREAKDPWNAVVDADGKSGSRPNADASVSPPEVSAEVDRGAATLPAGKQPSTLGRAGPATAVAEPQETEQSTDGAVGVEPKLKAEDVKRLAEEAEAKRLAEKAAADRKAALEAERKRLTDEAQAKRLAEEAAAERKAAKEAEARRLAEEAEAKRIAGSPPQRQSDGRQAPSDAKGSEPRSLPVAKEPASSRPGNDGLSTAGQEKLAATPSSPKETTTKVRVRRTSLRAQRVGKRRYRRRTTRARSGSRVYGSKTRRKCRRASRYRKRCWSMGTKQFSKRKIHRKRTVVSRYRKRHRVKVRGRSGMYVVRRRDTLWGIAKRYYGKGSKYRQIYRANRRKIRNPNRIYPGQRLYISAHRR